MTPNGVTFLLFLVSFAKLLTTATVTAYTCNRHHISTLLLSQHESKMVIEQRHTDTCAKKNCTSQQNTVISHYTHVTDTVCCAC